MTEASSPRSNNGRRGNLLPHEKLALKRELAAGEATQVVLAAKYGMSQHGISDFAKRNARAIDDIRDHLADPLAGLWIADKANRVSAYLDEFERLSVAKGAEHHEWSKARQAALRAVADELGAIPNRAQVTMTVVRDEVVGVDVEDIK